MNHHHTTALDFARENFALDPAGPHGEEHWLHVSEIGHRLAEVEDVDLEVVDLFALFHDLCRIGDGNDHGHGLRAAELTRLCRGRVIELGDERFFRLWTALAGHDRPDVDNGDPTVRVCWDAERLDLPRLGISPRPGLLYTETARREDVMAWAAEGAQAHHVEMSPPEIWLSRGCRAADA